MPLSGRLGQLTQTHAGVGRVDAIFLRPERLAPIDRREAVELTPSGLAGDHARPGKRAVTLIQAEHLPVIAALAGLPSVAPEMLRRNIVISGINLLALRHNRLRLGQAEISLTVPCAPCSRMERALGRGAYNAMRGHGGWCAEVIAPGIVRVGDPLAPVDQIQS